MRINLCANRYRAVHGNWYRTYRTIIEAFQELGYPLARSQYLTIGDDSQFPEIKVGLEDENTSTDIFVYNHSYVEDIKKLNLYRNPKHIFVKPTGPTPEHFTLDNLGYGCHISLCYDKPGFEGYDYEDFFENKTPQWIRERSNKWSDREDLKIVDLEVEIPDNHILILGQMPEDETVRNFSFGNHWEKVKRVVQEVENRDEPVVVKIHPELLGSISEEQKEDVKVWKEKGLLVLTCRSSLYDILPKTKVAILENSTSGIECLISKVPIISYGYPEYHWVTKDLRHIVMLNSYIDDMSWYNEELAKSFIAWYCEKFMCYDKPSTIRRLKQLI